MKSKEPVFAACLEYLLFKYRTQTPIEALVRDFFQIWFSAENKIARRDGVVWGYVSGLAIGCWSVLSDWKQLLLTAACLLETCSDFPGVP